MNTEQTSKNIFMYILFAGNKEFQNIAISNLWKKFAIGKEGNIQFKDLGLNLHYNNDTILIKQN